MDTVIGTAKPSHPAVSATSADLLRTEDLRVVFPTATGQARTVLRGIDLSVKPGEVLGLVGESGAGKTTLARSILGVPPAPGRIAGGRVIFEGRNILALSEKQLRLLRGRRLAMVVPNPRGELNPTVKIGDQIATMARVHLGLDRKAARDRAFEMLKAVQIPDPERRMNAYPHELSGGMAQRAVIAIALICDPAFVISDDATSGLDVTVQGADPRPDAQAHGRARQRHVVHHARRRDYGAFLRSRRGALRWRDYGGGEPRRPISVACSPLYAAPARRLLAQSGAAARLERHGGRACARRF